MLNQGLHHLKDVLPNADYDRKKASVDWRYAKHFLPLYYLVGLSGRIYQCDSRGHRKNDESLTPEIAPTGYAMLVERLKEADPQSYEVRTQVVLTLMPGTLGTTNADARNKADAILRKALEFLDRDGWIVNFTLLQEISVKDVPGVNYKGD